MLLCDLIARVAAFREDPARLGVPRNAVGSDLLRRQLTCAAGLAAEMRGWPRYILSDEVIAAATQVIMSRPRSIRDSMSVLRVPWPTAWVEWSEPARIAARQQYGISYDNGKPVPTRFGFLVTADETGRSGSVRFCWSHKQRAPEYGLVPDMSPIILRFELDRLTDPAAPTVSDEAKKSSDIYRRWAHSPEDVAALDEINRTCWLEAGHDARAIAAAGAAAMGRPQDYNNWLSMLLADVNGEQMPFLAVVMMLATRNAIETRAEDRTRLNKARKRRGEPELLDHVVAYLRLGKGEKAAGQSGHGGSSAAQARRAHMVRGHFVVRGETIYWRRAHTRGIHGNRPPAATRTIKVTI